MGSNSAFKGLSCKDVKLTNFVQDMAVLGKSNSATQKRLLQKFLFRTRNKTVCFFLFEAEKLKHKRGGQKCTKDKQRGNISAVLHCVKIQKNKMVYQEYKVEINYTAMHFKMSSFLSS